MLETMAMILCAIWVAGLVSGNALSGLIHLFLLGAIVSFFLHHRAASRAKSDAEAVSARHLARTMRGPAAATKTRPGRGSRSSAAA